MENIEIGMPNMAKLYPNDIPRRLTLAWKNKSVVALFGKPGVGKSASVKSWAEQKATELGLLFKECPTLEDWRAKDKEGKYINFCYSVILTSQMEEVDTKGIPVTHNENGRMVTKYSLSEMFPDEGIGILFIDELPNGRTSVQNAMQPILLENQAGNIKISKDIMFVVAGNRQQDNCGVYFIPSALRNRVSWYEVVEKSNKIEAIEDWLKIMAKIGKPIDNRLAGWGVSIGSEFFDNFNPDIDQYAYGSKRSITLASDEMQGITDLEDIRMIVAGRIGQAGADMLVTFLRYSEQVNIKEILAKPEKILKYQDGDRGLLYSICINITPYVVDEKHTANVFKVFKLLNRPEFGIFIINNLLKEKGKASAIKILTSCEEGRELAGIYNKILNG